MAYKLNCLKKEKKVWIKEEILEDWKTSLMCPIHKKEDKRDHNNYRGIALLNVVYKVFSNCTLPRIKEKAEQIIGWVLRWF